MRLGREAAVDLMQAQGRCAVPECRHALFGEQEDTLWQQVFMAQARTHPRVRANYWA